MLAELQAIADSSDPTRRTKGRRGLDIVKELQEVSVITLNIVDVSLRELGVESVDDGLLALAKRENAAILTTDYNLNKIAQIQGVQVMNVNDLANAMKPILLPGETVVVDIIREGKEPNQGFGYLDDGTMLVIEDGEGYIGKRVEVTYLDTSNLGGQNIFGRMRRYVDEDMVVHNSCRRKGTASAASSLISHAEAPCMVLECYRSWCYKQVL